MEDGEAAGFNDAKNTDLCFVRVDAIIPTHLAFEAKDRQEIEAFYKAALAASATENGGPGYRDYWPGCCVAFVHDPDGHNIEAAW